MAIKMLGDKFPMLTQALQAGIISPNDAITAARKGSDVKVVGKSLVDMEGNVLFTSEDSSGGDTTAFQTLKARASAAGLKEGTPAYQQFMMEGGVKKGMTLTSDGKGGFTMTQGGASIPKLTESQGKATGFYDRANKANVLLGGLEQQGTEIGARLIGEKQYFPQVGDKPEVIEQKRRNRETSANALRITAGAGAAALSNPASGNGKTVKIYDAQGNLISG